MRTLTVIAALCALAATASAQQFGGGNYVDSDYVDYQEPSRPAPPPPQRSFSRPPSPPPSAPVRSSQNLAPSGPRPTPVPILKQINRHNEDGSYTYGYEGADGSFKIETKLTSGEVMGKYGYVDDLGKVRVVEYGANKFGFQPSGEGITVAPPTLVDETKRQRPSGDQPDYDDGQYYEEQAPPRPSARAQRPQQAPQRFAPAPPPRPVARPPPPPPPQTYEQVYEPQEHRYQPAPPPPAPRRPAPSSLGPVPPRAQIPGAIPSGGGSGGVIYSQPAPIRPQPPPSAPLRPSPVYNSPPPPRPPPQRPQVRAAGGGGGILDQLARDYALPQGGAAPTSDVSFGFY